MPPIPPIPIHSNDPITASNDEPSFSSPTAAKPDGITPRTANPPPTRTTPASVPATTTSDPSLPPPPQPGARPLPPTSIARETGHAAPAPPQPVPGIGVPRSVEATVTSTATYQVVPMPTQFGVPPPTGAARGTDTTASTTPYIAGPTTLNLGPATSQYQPAHSAPAPTQTQKRSLEHPPGYMQDPYVVADWSASRRRQLEDAREEEGAGGAIWGALGRAGEVLKEAEEAVWRSVGKKG